VRHAQLQQQLPVERLQQRRRHALPRLQRLRLAVLLSERQLVQLRRALLQSVRRPQLRRIGTMSMIASEFWMLALLPLLPALGPAVAPLAIPAFFLLS
jgi:hypothetical protein